MNGLLGTQEISELSSDDGRTYIRVTDEREVHGLLQTSIEMAWQKEAVDPIIDGPSRKLSAQAISYDEDSDTRRRFLGHYGEFGAWNWFNAGSNFSQVVEDLGYDANVTKVEDGDYVVQSIVATAPSIRKWISLADSAPSNAKSFRFVEFDGGLYSAFYAMKQFVINHTVYLANQRPQTIHDIAEQAVGWFTLGGEGFLGEITKQTNTAIDRSEVEVRLPSFGNLERGTHHNYAFMHPAETFLKFFWMRLDELSGRVGDALTVFHQPDRQSHRTDDLRRILRNTFDRFSTTPPDSLINPISESLAWELADEVVERFDLLGRLAVDKSLPANNLD